jgi:hypothetical protein
MAWAAVILGIIGLVFSWIPFINVLTMLGALVGVVLGVIAVFGSRKTAAGIGTGLCVLAVVLSSVVNNIVTTATNEGRGATPSQPYMPSPTLSQEAARSLATPTRPINQVGQQFTNLGATVTVTMVRSASSIELNESNYRPGSGLESYTDVPAGPGANFVIVTTQVVNNAKQSMDLTCSLPIRTVLIDDQNRNFDPIDSLYKVKGNPECNDALQPGFAEDMTWVYRIPTGTHVLGWAFEDITDFSTIGRNKPTVIRIQVPGA